MAFADDLERVLAARANTRDQSEAAAQVRRPVREVKLREFKAAFAEAADHLAAEGGAALPVCFFHDATWARIYDVMPFRVIPIGGLFLHDGALYAGRLSWAPSSFPAEATGLRRRPWRGVPRELRVAKGERVVQVHHDGGPPYVLKCVDDLFTIAEDTPARGDYEVGDLVCRFGWDERPRHAMKWLLEAAADAVEKR